MDLQLKLIDEFKLMTNETSKIHCSFSEDNRILLTTQSGVYILSFGDTLGSEDEKFLFKKSFIDISNFTPGTEVNIPFESFFYSLPIEENNEIKFKKQHFVNTGKGKPVEAFTEYAEWSHKNLVPEESCALGILSDLGTLGVYSKILNEDGRTMYILVANITKNIISEAAESWTDPNRFGKKLKTREYIKRVDSVGASAFTWSHVFTVDNIYSSVIFVGHLNGDLSIWKINANMFTPKSDCTPTFLGRYKTNLNCLTKMYWRQSREYDGALFCGDIDGKLDVFHIKDLNTSNAVFGKQHLFLSKIDKKQIDDIFAFEHEKYTFLIIIKGTIILMFAIDDNGDLVDMTHFEYKSYCTGLYYEKNKILVLSTDGKLLELTIALENNKIKTEQTHVSLNHEFTRYHTQCIFSKNKTLFFVFCFSWNILGNSKSKYNLKSLVYCNLFRKPLELLWNNTSDTLRDYWDCFETLRLISLKEKQFPWIGLPQNINYDTLPLTKLKTLRFIAKISEAVFNNVIAVKTYSMQSYILVHYLLEIKLVVERLSRLFKNNLNNLTVFQLRSIYLQNIFLREMVARNILPKANVGKKYLEMIWSVSEIANALEYPEPLICVWCRDKILGPTCLPPHSDSRCCFSMMPIFLVPEYKCEYCKAVAHKEMEKEMSLIICPYCDIVMDKVYIDHDELKEKLDAFQKESKQFTDCHDDCLQETFNYDNLVQNYVEYSFYSTDEDDEPEMINLYEKFSKTNLSDLKLEVDDQLKVLLEKSSTTQLNDSEMETEEVDMKTEEMDLN